MSETLTYFGVPTSTKYVCFGTLPECLHDCPHKVACAKTFKNDYREDNKHLWDPNYKED